MRYTIYVCPEDGQVEGSAWRTDGDVECACGRIVDQIQVVPLRDVAPLAEAVAEIGGPTLNRALLAFSEATR
jgi:hypothetical protein